MDSIITLRDVANIVTFIAPGYFALQTYSTIYAKRERESSRLLIECAVFSLPLLATTNFIWERLLSNTTSNNVDTVYVLLLVAISLCAGLAASVLRVRFPIKDTLNFLGVGHPDEDFIRHQFSRLDRNGVTTVKLKDGTVFSGTPERGRVYSRGSPERYYFNNIAWYSAVKDTWTEQEAGIIIDLQEVQYIVTGKLKPEAELSTSFRRGITRLINNWKQIKW